jgi:hypothetical protein
VGPEESVLQHSAKKGFMNIACNILQNISGELAVPLTHNQELDTTEAYNSPQHIMQLMHKVLPETSKKKLIQIMKQTWGKANLDPQSHDILQTLGTFDIMDKDDKAMLENEAAENKLEADQERARLLEVHKFCHEQLKQVRQTRNSSRSSSSSSASTVSSPSTSGRGRGRGRGRGQGRAPTAKAKAKAKAQADAAAKAKDENAAGYWRSASSPGNTFHPDGVKKFAPPDSEVHKDSLQRRWLGSYQGHHHTAKSWTLLYTECQAVKLILRYLWDCRAQKLGRGPGRGVDICPWNIIYQDEPHASSQPSRRRRQKGSG